MDQNKYEAVILAADQGSLSAAAQMLGYTQSGITRMIKGLEEELGFPLFIRTKKGVALTENGRLMMPYFREMVRTMQSMQQLSADISGTVLGNITIGSCYSIAAMTLPEMIKGFQSLHPGVTISLHEGGNIALARSLQDRSVDICFGLRPSEVQADWIELFRDEIVAWVPHGHRLEAQGFVSAKDLEQEAFIYTQPDQDTEIDRMLSQLGVHPNVRFTTHNAYTTYNMVAAGLGISLDQRLRSREWSGAVAELPFEPRQSEAYGTAVPSLREVSPAAKTFMEYVRESIGAR